MLHRLLLVATALTLLLYSLSVHANELDDAARRVRVGTLVIKTVPGAEVRVEQVRHEFWFGAALANQAFDGRMNEADAAKYREVFLANFNAAVTENALKWHAMEREQGNVNYATVDAILRWTDEHHIPLRGHNVFWGVPNMLSSWIKCIFQFRHLYAKRSSPL